MSELDGWEGVDRRHIDRAHEEAIAECRRHSAAAEAAACRAAEAAESLAAAARWLRVGVALVGVVCALGLVLAVYIDRRGQSRDARLRHDAIAQRVEQRRELCERLDHKDFTIRQVLRSFDPRESAPSITSAILAFTPPNCPDLGVLYPAKRGGGG